jgi:tetratricopeptide (TPR) repeat protein
VFLCVGQNFCFAQKDGDPISIGTYKVLHSNILNEDRLLFVHLPREYDETRLRYPVLYIFYVDLYNYFTEAASISEKLGGTGEMPPLIIVGVANTNRYRDLLPVKSRGIAESGGADNFLRFVEEELIPHIDRTYRTKNFRIAAGPQAAAVFSLYALIMRPNLFQATISENPFMNPDNAEYLLPLSEQFFRKRTILKHYLYIKCEKNERAQELESARRFAAMLDSTKPQGFGVSVEFRESSGDFIPPLPFSEAFRSIFAAHKLQRNFQTSSLQDILNYYKERSEEYGFPVDPPDLMLTFEGDKVQQRGRMREAIGIFNYQLQLNPKSLNALLRLGEAYRVLGEYGEAKKYYSAFLDVRATDAAFIQRRLHEMERMIDSSAAYRFEQEIKQNGIQSALKTYRKIKADPSNRMYFAESEFNAVGYRLLGSGQLNDAIEVFKLNVELYPESANVYDSLGEAYMNSGDIENAKRNYRMSLRISPDNKNARERLRVLENR